MTTPNFVRLTREHDSKPIWVNPALVHSICEDSTGVTRLWHSEGEDAYIRVLEPVDEVMAIIRGERG